MQENNTKLEKNSPRIQEKIIINKEVNKRILRLEQKKKQKKKKHISFHNIKSFKFSHFLSEDNQLWSGVMMMII